MADLVNTAELYNSIRCTCSDMSEYIRPIGLDDTYFYLFCSRCGKILTVKKVRL